MNFDRLFGAADPPQEGLATTPNAQPNEASRRSHHPKLPTWSPMSSPVTGSPFGLSLSTVKMGMARAAEELLDRLHLGHSAIRSLRAALLAGDEARALEEYTSVDKLGKCLAEEMHPSMAFTVSRRPAVQTTALHLAAEGALYDIMRLFLEHGADPNIRTSRNETAVHSVCQKGDRPGHRLACLKALLAWVGPEADGVRDKASVNSVDARGCTAVHHAAAHGMTTLVEVLVEHGANLTIVNAEQETPSDLASSRGHEALADWLEAHVIFAASETEDLLLSSISSTSQADAAVAEGLPTSSERGAVAAAPESRRGDGCSTFVSLSWEEVESKRLAAIRDAGLAKGAGGPESNGPEEELVECLMHACSWRKPELCRALQRAPPDEVPELLKRCHVEGYAGWLGVAAAAPPPVMSDKGDKGAAERCCPICREVGEGPPALVQPCQHAFCPDCLKAFIEHQVLDSNPELLRCPEFSCYSLLPGSLLKDVGVSEQVLARYQAGRVRAFVERADWLCYCPAPGCEWVVERGGQEEEEAAGLKDDGDAAGTSMVRSGGHGAVRAQCKDGHHFCWECKQEPHFPCSCEAWRAWTEVVAKETLRAQEDVKRKAVLAGGGGGCPEKEAELLANALWLSANTKECPKCGTPIEKTSGCNHMACGNRTCRYEWCWICSESWELHSNKTGGFFRCNRFLDDSGQAATDLSSSGGEHGAATNGEGGPSLSPAMAGGAEDGRLLLDEATLAELEEEEDEAVLEALLMGVGGGALSQRGGSNGSSSSPTTTLQMLEQRRQQVLKAQKGSAIQEAKRMADQSRRMARFIHHYTRFRAHRDSCRLEKVQEPETRERVMRCLSVWQQECRRKRSGEETDISGSNGFELEEGEPEGGGVAVEGDVSFLDGAFEELCRSRVCLQNSYAFAFFELAHPKDLQGFVPDDSKLMQAKQQATPREGSGSGGESERSSSRRLTAKRHIFERHQSELEMMVETLSGLIDPPRHRLHASKAEIVAHTAAVDRKRVEFEQVMARGLDALVADLPPSSSPPPRRSRTRHKQQHRDGRRAHRDPHLRYLYHHGPDGLAERAGLARSLLQAQRGGRQSAEGGGEWQQGGLLSDMLASAELAGLDGIDLEVAMMDRAIHLSLQPPPSGQPPPATGQPQDASPAERSSGSVDGGSFTCSACTLINYNGGQTCELCGTARTVEAASG